MQRPEMHRACLVCSKESSTTGRKKGEKGRDDAGNVARGQILRLLRAIEEVDCILKVIGSPRKV